MLRVARVTMLSMAVAGLLAGAVVLPAKVAGVVHADGTTECATGTSTAELNDFFGRQVADVVGFDSVRVYPLPDGRSLWLAQDAYLTTSPGAIANSLRPPIAFAHNIGLVQEGNCFTTLHGPVTAGRHCEVAEASYVGRELTGSCSHWFWPMGGGLDAQGHLAVFFAEMTNPSGAGAAPGASTVGVWLATIDTATFDVLSFTPAPASDGNVAFGYGVESDNSFTYLFGYSHDQFNRPDPSSPSPSQAFVARVPRGHFDLAPEYWDGTRWTSSRAVLGAISDAAGDSANPMQPRRMDGMWVSVVKLDDWFGFDVQVQIATQPQGPWMTVQRVTAPTRTANGATNTYAAHLLPWRSPDGNLMIAMSNNAWAMDPVAFANPALYRPTFFELTAPFGLRTGPPPAVLSPPLSFVPAAPPVRVADTRLSDRLAAKSIAHLDLTGLVADDAAAAAINLTMVSPSADGFLTVWPCDQALPTTSNVNASRGETRAAHAVVDIALDHTICIYNHTATDVVVDVDGWYVPTTTPGALGFHAVESTRIYDSRSVGRRFTAGEVRRIPVPAGAQAIAANVTVTEPTGAGFVTVFPCNAAVPKVSSVNVAGGETVANLVQVGASNGEVCVYSMIRAHVVIDLVGTYDTAPDGLHYQSIAPRRLADTRTGVGTVNGPVALDMRALGVLPAQAPVALTTVPGNVRAVMTSMIVVGPRTSGWAVTAPCKDNVFATPFTTSTLNFTAGDIVANQSIVPTRATSGRDVCTYATSPANHVVDLVGWFI